jgi:polar amino acid transport system substrate-binding protein
MLLSRRLITLAQLLLAGAALPARAETYDFGPEQKDRPHTSQNEEAIKAVAPGFKWVKEGVLTVAISPAGPPLGFYATDAVTVVGADPDYALLLAESLGRKLELVSVPWADWPLGLASGKYDAVISNVGVTEERKQKFDFSTYRQGLHGFYVKADSPITSIREPRDLAGLRVLVSSGTNQERILLEWNKRNIAAGLKPIDLQYYDDEPARLLALASGRADVIVQPHAQLVFIAARDRAIKSVGTLSAGWPDRSDVAVATRKGLGLAEALTVATNELIQQGTYAALLNRWGLFDEALPRSETNPPGLPKF